MLLAQICMARSCLQNYVDIYSLGHPIEANGYVLLVLAMQLYALLFFCWSIVLFIRMRKTIAPPTGKDAGAFLLCFMCSLVVPRVDHVNTMFNSLASFYIDQYGFWLIHSYLLLFMLLITASQEIVCLLKMIENTILVALD
jgi:hypothetical protein